MDYDLAVIGAGWAGFNSALKAKALGLKVALIEKEQIGGTCLNRGCIPAKALIQSSRVYNLAKRSGIFGVKAAEPEIDLAQIHSRKNKIIEQLRQGMSFSLRGIDLLSGEARITGSNTLRVGAKDSSSRFMLIATGSKPAQLKGIRFDADKIVSSDDMLASESVPGSLLIIGAGAIGCEFANLFASFGSKVTIVEMMPQLLPGIDKEAARKAEAAFKKKGIEVVTSADANRFDLSRYDKVLLSVGRSAVTEGLGLEQLGIKTEKGMVIVDDSLKTSIPNIYAAGDCASRIMLAHFAAYQGCIAAENMAAGPSGNLKRSDERCVPACIFTEPEIGAVGLTEDEAKERKIDINVNKFDLLGSGMARIMDEANGFIKIISFKGTEEVAGASIVGPRAAELIGILAVAVQSRLKTSQIRDTIFAHPTLSEGIISALKGYGV